MMLFNIFLLNFFVLISSVKRVFGFNNSDLGCVYKKQGKAVLPEGTFNYTIDFFLPFNWEKWNENHELIIILNNLLIVLTHSSNQNSLEWMKEKKKVEFLMLDYLRIGWNRIWLSKSRQNVVISDVDKNIWLHKSMESAHKWDNWKVYGLFSFVNCGDETYRYFNVSGTNNKIPLVAKDDKALISVHSNKTFQMDINLSRRKEQICCEDKKGYYYMNENMPCEFNKTEQYFSNNLVNRIGFYLRKDNDNQENSLTIENYTYTDFLIHDFDNSGIMVRTTILFTDVYYLVYWNNSKEEPGIEEELTLTTKGKKDDEMIEVIETIDNAGAELKRDDTTEKILAISNAFSLIIVIVLLIAYIRERRITIIARKNNEEQSLASKEEPNRESVSGYYASYELQNEDYEDFNSRTEKTNQNHSKDQYEGSEIYELNNSLYKNLDQRKSEILRL